MEDGEAVAEAGAEARDGLRGEADLGDEDDRAPAAGERRLDRGQVDLGLARAGDPVQELLARAAGRPVERRDDGLDRARLLGQELRRLARAPREAPAARPACRAAPFAHPGPRRQDQPQAARGRRAVLARRPRGRADQLRRAPASSASIGSARRSGGSSEDSASSTTTPSRRRGPKGTRTRLPTSSPAIAAGRR